MLIVLIEANELGGHDNNFINGSLGFVPTGWAVIRGNEELKNFPFGSFEVEHIDGVPYMKEGSWIPGKMPEPEPVPEPEQPEFDTNVWDELDAAYQEGVDSV